MEMKLTPEFAHDVLRSHPDRAERDFHALSSGAVDYLISHANQAGYRKPKNANGSRARYFHAYLQRLVARRTE
jgi:hypothetical protein